MMGTTPYPNRQGPTWLSFDELSDAADEIAGRGERPTSASMASRFADVPPEVIDGHLMLWQALRDDASGASSVSRVRVSVALRLVRILECAGGARRAVRLPDPLEDSRRQGREDGRVDVLERRLRTAATHVETLCARLARQVDLARAWRERCRRLAERMTAALEAPEIDVEGLREIAASLRIDPDEAGPQGDQEDGARGGTGEDPAVREIRNGSLIDVDAAPPDAPERARVERAAGALVEAGVPVSVEAIGHRLGGGDVLVIERHLEEWRERAGPLEVIGFGAGALGLAAEIERLVGAEVDRVLAAERATAAEARAALESERAISSAALERTLVLDSRLSSAEELGRIARRVARRRGSTGPGKGNENAAMRARLEVLEAERDRLRDALARRGPATADGSVDKAREAREASDDGRSGSPAAAR